MENNKAIAKALLRHEDELRTILGMLNRNEGFVQFYLTDGAIDVEVLSAKNKATILSASFSYERVN
jgi:hypothetical protein